jgi:chromosome partitioning protein
MIVTIANCALQPASDLVAENLALLRVRSGRDVLLLDATPRRSCEHWAGERTRMQLRPTLATRALRGYAFADELEDLQARFADIVIDTDGSGYESRCALIAALVAVVPLAPEHADVGARYELIARLNSARMFNPGLRVLFVTTGQEDDPDAPERRAMRNYTTQVMSASLAATVIHLPALRRGADAPGRCASDTESSTGAVEMAALYREVYQADPVFIKTRKQVTT